MAYLDARSPERANGFVEAFDQTCELYADKPLLGALAGKRAPGIRYFTVWNYITFYRPTPAGVLVIRITHGARDVPELLDSN